MATLAQARDEKLLEGIIEHKYLRADQAAELFFKNIKDPLQRKQKAATRLLSLFRKKQVQRFKYPGEPFIYTCSGTRHSPKILHYLTVTDVLLNILSILPSDAAATKRLEYRQGNCITDLYLRAYRASQNLAQELYIEVELNATQDIKAKINKYEELLIDRQHSRLIIVCKHKRTIDHIKGNVFIIPVQAISLKNIREQFKL